MYNTELGKALATFISRLLLLSILSVSTLVSADERILAFHSEVEVIKDGSLIVTETIRVRAENRQIKRGIYRDLPTIYMHPKYGHLGVNQTTPIDILSVYRNGKTEPWFKQQLDNGFRIYIGQKERFISRGVHEFIIKYRAQRQALREANFGKVHWNVTGQGWSFPIDKVTALFTYPNNLSPSFYTATTGDTGSQDSNATLQTNARGQLVVETTWGLGPHQGLTVYSEFDKHTLVKPSFWQANLLTDNWKLFASLLLLLIMPIYYFKAWDKVGRDPAKGVVVADYHPVRNLSPAAHRAAVTNKTDEKSFAAAVLNMAVKGYLTIEQESKKVFTLRKLSTKQGQPLASGEQIIFNGLFKGTTQVTLGEEYHPEVALAKTRFASHLKQEYSDALYLNNKSYTWLGLAIGIAALVLLGLHTSNVGVGLGQLFPILIFAFIALGFTQSTRAIPFFLIGAIFMGASGIKEIVGSVNNWPLLVASVMVGAIFALFYYLLKAPTPFGQKLLDEIEGFRLYLSTAEQNRLDILHPPEKTPQLFEKLLPYALALDVENQWSEQFAKVFENLEQENHHGTRHYSPSWYSGGRFDSFSGGDMGASLGAGLASSVAAATTAPSSSSSGGGFSGGAGGGGGGGGGGGW